MREFDRVLRGTDVPQRGVAAPVPRQEPTSIVVVEDRAVDLLELSHSATSAQVPERRRLISILRAYQDEGPILVV